MAGDAPQPEAAGPDAGSGALRRTWRLARGWYVSEERWTAWGLTAAMLGLTLLQLGLMLRINLWNRDFFDALERREGAALGGQLGLFALLGGLSVAALVAQLWSRQMLALRWRSWLVRRLQTRWLEAGRHYHIGFVAGAADNPDQRISENTRWATATAVELAAGLLQAGLTAVSFLGLLWALSGALPVALGGVGFEVPGYMVIVALLYAGIGAVLAWAVGRPLVGINIRRNQAEGDHRFGLLRLRESAEAVVLIRGAADEERGLRRLFGGVVAVMLELLRRERHLMWLGGTYLLLTPVLPILVASPRYLSGAISLGVLMQVAQAFTEVTRALMWFQENYPRLADWRGHVERVVALEDSLAAADAARAASPLVVAEGPDAAGREVLAFSGLRILRPEDGGGGGTVAVVAEATAEIRAGERVLIRGGSGAGKSSLLRAVAGAWPWAEGRIRVPPREAMMVLPQRPYLPLGTLREAVCYPAGPGRFPDAVIGAALARCGLAELAASLDAAERWDGGRLSLGQQQRLAFARLLLHRPRWVLLDEATSALDEAGQEVLLRLVEAELPGSAVVSVGSRPGLEAYHDRVLVPGPGGSRMVAVGAGTQPWPPPLATAPTPGSQEVEGRSLPAVVSGQGRAILPPPEPAVVAATGQRRACTAS